MALYAFVPRATAKLWGLVYDDSLGLLNVFFRNEYDLSALKSDLGTGVPDVNVPADPGEHMRYHGELADKLQETGSPTELVDMVRNADPRHGHMQVPAGEAERENMVGVLVMRKWVDRTTGGRLAGVL